MDVSRRDDFPLLKRQIDGKPVTYLDSAATTLKPRQVLEAEHAYSTQFTANIHRGRHALSEEASAAYEAARRRVARFLRTVPKNVVFVRNATEGLNLVASGLGLSKQDVVLAPSSEHHSNLVPWMRAATLQWLEADPLEPLNPEQVKDALVQHRPRVFVFAQASNVTGLVQPAAELCRVARALGVLTVVDASQSAPHLPIDLEALDCDFLAFSGHKMLGPTGIGVLTGRSEALDRLEPLILGGGVVDRVTRDGYTLKAVPYRLEAGTPHISGALGLHAAIDYLEDVGFDTLAAHDAALARALAESLAELPRARVLMAPPGKGFAIATVAPLSERLSADQLAIALSASHQIMVRSGFHCAHPYFDTLALNTPSLRASAYLYNTEEEVRRFGTALRSLLARLGG